MNFKVGKGYYQLLIWLTFFYFRMALQKGKKILKDFKVLFC